MVFLAPPPRLPAGRNLAWFFELRTPAPFMVFSGGPHPAPDPRKVGWFFGPHTLGSLMVFSGGTPTPPGFLNLPGFQPTFRASNPGSFHGFFGLISGYPGCPDSCQVLGWFSGPAGRSDPSSPDFCQLCWGAL